MFGPKRFRSGWLRLGPAGFRPGCCWVSGSSAGYPELRGPARGPRGSSFGGLTGETRKEGAKRA